MSMIKKTCQSLLSFALFDYFIVFLILLNAVLLGLETVDGIKDQYKDALIFGNNIILGFFIAEALIKIIAVAPRFGKYFFNGWNFFDFSIIVLSILPMTAEYAMIARLFRLLRILRLISAFPQLRLIVTTLLRSIPSMGHVFILLAILFYIYGIIGYHLFHEQLPDQWGSLPRTLLTLFTIATLEGWADLLKECMKITPWAWVYFISFIVTATFIIINLFIAIVLDNMKSAKSEVLHHTQNDNSAVLLEIEQLENQLQSLKQILSK